MIQILTCNNDLGTCCSDYGLVGLIDAFAKIFDFIQFFVPILLLIGLTYQLTKFVINPEQKNGSKKFTAMFKSALIIFFIPTVVNAVLVYLPGAENLEIGACWKEASKLKEKKGSSESSYIETTEDKNKKHIITVENNDGVITTTTTSVQTYKVYSANTYTAESSSGTQAGDGSVKGKAIVDYALQFVGHKYVWGGTWNGELPYTGTDCSGFVQGVFKHNKINLTRTTSSQWADTKSYTLVSANNIQAGDLVMYEGHVGILTGNGNQLVHAANSKTGIVLAKDYRYIGKVKGIMRIKGVN